MRKLLYVVMTLAVIMSLAVMPAMAKPEYSLKFASVIPEKDHIGQAVNEFAKLVAEKSDGRVEVKVFHGGQLGSGKETFEAVQAGFLDIAGDSYANLYTLTPAFEAFHLPYIFESRDQQLAAYHSEKVKDVIDEELLNIGLKWLMTLEFGPRQLGTTEKKIDNVHDIAGMKIRASRSPLEIASHEAWGAKGVTIDWPEVPETLRLGMVDGETVSFDAFWSANHHQGLINYIAETNFQVYGYSLVVNAKWWNELPEDIRGILKEAAAEAETWHEEMLPEFVNMNIQEMKDAGVEVYGFTAEEMEEFKNVTRDAVWSKFVGESVDEDFVELIQEEIGEPGPFEDRWYFEY